MVKSGKTKKLLTGKCFSGTTSALYSAAAQTADFGAALTAGQSFTVGICQVSARLGRGTPAIVTLFT
jgi:hypothetical protein